MYSALAVLRVAVLVWAVAINAYRNNFERPVLAWAAIGLMAATTVAMIALYSASARRGPAVLVVDLASAVGMLLITPVAKGEWFHATIPGFWIVGALLAWGVRYGWRGGAAAGVLLGAVDLLSRVEVSQQDASNVFLLLLGGSMVGFLCESLKQMAVERECAQQDSAAAAERARLARVVHDGVLQVLALVQRRGTELGGDGAQLGQLAGEQEQALRTLIRSQDAVSGAAVAGGPAVADLAAALGVFATRHGIEVALPAGAVEMSAHAVAELTAVVGACLDNVARHVGEDAPAWVLVEDLGDRVEVSVRDEGPGIPDGRLAVAQEQGRLGVLESIRGRIRDLGGSAVLDTGNHGTEWTVTVPRPEQVS